MKSLTPQELRLNNLVLINGETRQIAGIIGELIYAHHTDAHKVLNTPEAVFGIPITEEWLLNFGLSKAHGGFDRFTWHRSAIYFKEGRWIYGILGDDNNSYYHVSELQYVHQLQNLYFSLTGQELKT
jgi:hypothetical protein